MAKAPGAATIVGGSHRGSGARTAIGRPASKSWRIGLTPSGHSSCSTKSPRRGCPSKLNPNKSSASRSCQSTDGPLTRPLIDGTTRVCASTGSSTYTHGEWASWQNMYVSNHAGCSSTTKVAKAKPSSPISHSQISRSVPGRHSMWQIRLTGSSQALTCPAQRARQTSVRFVGGTGGARSGSRIAMAATPSVPSPPRPPSAARATAAAYRPRSPEAGSRRARSPPCRRSEFAKPVGRRPQRPCD